MQPKVSIIIPAYNAEKTLKRCLDSVFAQDFDSYEVILVNDGSKDGTLEVARKFEKYPNFVLIDQLNRGVARARWEGIKVSKGDYLSFVDSDDFIAPNMVFKMYKKAIETNAEIVVCCFGIVGDKKMPLREYSTIWESGREATGRLLRGGVSGTLWDKLFKKELIGEEEYFKTFDLSYGEDVLLVALTIPKARIVTYMNEVLYYKVWTPDSLTQSPSLKALGDYAKARKAVYEIVDSMNFPKDILNKITFYYAERLLYIMKTLHKFDSNSEVKDLKNCVRKQMIALPLKLSLKEGRYLQQFAFLSVKIGVFDFVFSVWEHPLFYPIRLLKRAIN